MPVRVKICGIRSIRDLDIAVRSGADAVGFISGVTHFSEDALSPADTARLSRLVPPYVSRVLVTHLEDAADILALAYEVGVDTIQVHGIVALDQVSQVRDGFPLGRITKAIHVTGRAAIDDARDAIPLCDALHLDSRTGDRLGGTGLTHDWTISRDIVRLAGEHGRPVVLSGGLTPENVVAAMRIVQPYAVDVNSGVEDAAGDKLPSSVMAFVDAAHASAPSV